MRPLWPLSLPVLGQMLCFLFGPGGSRGAFQAGALLLTSGVAVFAFLPLSPMRTVRALAGVAVCALVVHAIAAGIDGAPAVAWLLLGVGAAAAGMAGFGVAIGTSRVAAGVIASLLLWAAMTATFWADGVAAQLPVERRPEVRQAIVHVDPLLACAYGAAGHDRLHDADVYTTVPLASALIEPPSPLPTGALWLGVGLVLASAAWVVRARRPD